MGPPGKARYGRFDFGPLGLGDRMPERLGRRSQVLRAARADHDLGHPLVGQQPAERQSGQ